jgi:hypothetical protein
MLAIKHCLAHIVEGAEIIVFTDHESLKGFRTQKHMTKRLARFMGEIEHFDPMIVYRPGKEQVVADALSRVPGAREEGDKELFVVRGEEKEEEKEKEEKEEIPDIVAKDVVHEPEEKQLPDLVGEGNVHEPENVPDVRSSLHVRDGELPATFYKAMALFWRSRRI